MRQQVRSGQVRSRQVRSGQVLPPTTVCQPAIKPPTPPKHTHSEAQRGHHPVQNVPDPDGAGAGELGMAAVPLPHPDSTVPWEECPMLAGPGGGALLRPIQLDHETASRMGANLTPLRMCL